jgi:hypothetical protein
LNRTILLLSMILLATPGQAQTAEDSIKATVNALFLAMKASDPAKLSATFDASAVLQTIAKDGAGETVVKNEQVKDFADAISKLPAGDADERVEFGHILIDGPMATVWAPYKFFYKGTFSHCGVDMFQLVRMKGGWKIVYLIDTRRKEPCL